MKKFTAFYKTQRKNIVTFDVMTADAGEWQQDLKLRYAFTNTHGAKFRKNADPTGRVV